MILRPDPGPHIWLPGTASSLRLWRGERPPRCVRLLCPRSSRVSPVRGARQAGSRLEIPFPDRFRLLRCGCFCTMLATTSAVKVSAAAADADTGSITAKLGQGLNNGRCTHVPLLLLLQVGHSNEQQLAGPLGVII